MLTKTNAKFDRQLRQGCPESARIGQVLPESRQQTFVGQLWGNAEVCRDPEITFRDEPRAVFRRRPGTHFSLPPSASTWPQASQHKSAAFIRAGACYSVIATLWMSRGQGAVPRASTPVRLNGRGRGFGTDIRQISAATAASSRGLAVCVCSHQCDPRGHACGSCPRPVRGWVCGDSPYLGVVAPCSQQCRVPMQRLKHHNAHMYRGKRTRSQAQTNMSCACACARANKLPFVDYTCNSTCLRAGVHSHFGSTPKVVFRSRRTPLGAREKTAETHRIARRQRGGPGAMDSSTTLIWRSSSPSATMSPSSTRSWKRRG